MSHLKDARLIKKTFFFAFPWVVTSTGPGGSRLCVYFMTGTPEGSTESVFMEKHGLILSIL